ncbi:MAG: hypothetical protein ACYTFY_11705, partial [Planctomycetota bacterium]|jgi:hypothetical protein
MTSSDTAKVIKMLKAPYMIDRIEGIRAAGKITEKQLLKDFKIIDHLLDTAKDSGLTPSERSESMQALVQLANRQMTDGTHIVENLAKMIKNKKTDIEVRIDALVVLGSLGKVKGKTIKEEEFIKKVHKMIKEIAEKSINKTSLRSSAFKVLGSMAIKGSEDIFIEAINTEKKTAIREAALLGLRNYIEITGNTSQKIMNSICSTTVKFDEKKERNLRISGILAIEQFLANGTKLIYADKVTDFLKKTMSKGDDEEMITASKCLLRIKDADIIDAYIKELEKQRGLRATLALVKGTVELFRPLSNIANKKTSSSKNRSKAEKNAAKIIDKILIPLAKLSGAPDKLRITAIIGLGAIPKVFAREKAAESLIMALPALLKDSKKEELSTEVQRSLMQISRREKPFLTEADTIDAEAWKEWYDKNKDYLKAGKAPWDKDD